MPMDSQHGLRRETWTLTLSFAFVSTMTLANLAVPGVVAASEIRSRLFRKTKGVQLDHAKQFQLCRADDVNCLGSERRSCVLGCSTRDDCTGVNFRPTDGSCMGVNSAIYSFGSTLVRDSAWDNFSPVADFTPTQYVRDGQDWILVFRAQSSISQTQFPGDGIILKAWNNDSARSEDSLPDMDSACYSSLKGPCTTVYRSGLLTDWPSQNIDQVRVSLYKAGTKVKELTFNGTGSNKTSWFQTDRLVHSSWSDLLPGAANFISIPGKLQNRRVFTVVKTDSENCPEEGWFLVMDNFSNVCSFDLRVTYNINDMVDVPHFLYSPSTVNVNFDSGQYQEADVMAVFVKLR